MAGLVGFISMPGGAEWVVIALVGLLVFGRRLPEVARSLGQTIVSFKKGLREAERELAAPEGREGLRSKSGPAGGPTDLPAPVEGATGEPESPPPRG